jgi:hypothetical protein
MALLPSAILGADDSTLEVFTPAPPPTHRLVLRVSDAMFSSYLARDIEQQVSVRDVILGTPVTGTALIEAKPHVKLLERPDHAAFHIEFRGTAVSRTVGHAGPAVIYSHSVTHFTATKQIVYEAGKGFFGAPVQVAARTQNYTEGIASTRRGLIGRIVRRRAAEQIAAKKALTTEISRQKAAQRIAAAFEERMAARIAHLNAMVESQSLLTSLATMTGQMPCTCSSTANHVQVAAGRAASSRPIALPVRGPASDTAAPVELWVHNSLLPERPGRFVESIDRISRASEVSDGLTALLSPTALLRKRSVETAIRGLASRFAVQSIDGWVVVEVLPDGQNALSRTAAVSTPVR